MVPLQFRLGTRRITALGTYCDHHRNVLHLQVLPSAVSRFFSWLCPLLPSRLASLVQSWLPEWFLPPRIVLKRQKKGWEEEFDNEKDIYQALAPVQGKVVPVCYGVAKCSETETTGTRALVLSDVGGVALHEEAAGGVPLEKVEKMLAESFRAVADLNVAHDDYKLDNYRLVGDKILLIDFDSSYIFETEDPEFVTSSSVKSVSYQYNNLHLGGKNFRWI